MNFDDISQLIFNNIESLLDDIGMTAPKLCEKAGLGRTAIYDMKKLGAQGPGYVTLLKLADAAGVDVRRITIGPDFREMDDAEAELISLLFQLEPSERQFLLSAARARIAERGQSL